MKLNLINCMIIIAIIINVISLFIPPYWLNPINLLAIIVCGYDLYINIKEGK